MPTYYSMIRCHRIMCHICGAHFFEHERSDICNSMPAAGYMYNTESALKLLVRVPAAVCCLLVPSSRCYVPLPVGDTRAVTDEYTWGPHLSLHSATGSEGKGRGGAIGPRRVQLPSTLTGSGPSHPAHRHSRCHSESGRAVWDPTSARRVFKLGRIDEL
jgi:hypothetical protein